MSVRTVINVPLCYSNWGGIHSQVTLDAPKGTPQDELVAAALTYLRVGRHGNPAFWKYRGHDLHDFDMDPATWQETGRGRLMGRAVAFETIADMREQERERLQAIVDSSIYQTETRERALRILTDLAVEKGA